MPPGQYSQAHHPHLKSNKSAAQAAVKMLHTNSVAQTIKFANASKNPKLVTDSGTAPAVGASGSIGTAGNGAER